MIGQEDMGKKLGGRVRKRGGEKRSYGRESMSKRGREEERKRGR